MKDNILFAKNFFKNPSRNASLVPSSNTLSKKLINGIDFDNINYIMELGPGTGVITQEIIKNMKTDSKLILVELENSYVDMLFNRYSSYSNIFVEKNTAENMFDILSKYEFPKLDIIISSLPILPEKNRTKLVNNILKADSQWGSVYRTITYMPFIFKKVYKNMGLELKERVISNFPPVWIRGKN
ncbi:class I SAM-dependent methyltransferase [Candidatus Vampirococcus lugosii]|uniref:Ribosomal RNA adenine dimethylase n=1 Tax=Candidatus Vampirococcus lugosii TaxID=2789015 RepID=A0ABS5QM99_9BACT|nr:hypothetical protein [Candidatus Vampirococcus lugosii]MBS8122330.1 Ribosomal RNA adenine dimethylase [Candidatus Vampirococcus lugosii]